MNWGGIFHVPRRMDSAWKQRLMALGRASTGCPEVETDCAGSFEVANNSLERAVTPLGAAGDRSKPWRRDTGAVLEMVGG